MGEPDASTGKEEKPECYSCNLPVPFVRGRAVDYQKMTADQLRRFIHFMYKSEYNQNIPPIAKNGVKPPPWWPITVKFEKSLALKSSHKGVNVQKELANLVRLCYESVGLPSLLAIGKEIAARKYTLVKKQSQIQSHRAVTDSSGRTIIMIDKETWTYDTITKDRDVLIDKESQENLNLLEDQQPKTVRPTRQTSNLSKSSRKKPATKRKLFDDPKEGESHPCQYCDKNFKYAEFREDHESVCDRGPNRIAQETQLGLMNALGMFGLTQKKTEVSSNKVQPAASNPRSRTLRKLPKRNQLLHVLKTNPIPISSHRGQGLIAEFGEKAEVSFPPAYEKQCKPASGFPISDKEYPCVAKRAILKDGENPHVYTNGRLQRTQRYQELVIGVNESCWGLLNRCRKARIIVDKLDPKIKHVLLPKSAKKRSYLDAKWNAAMNYPRVRLVDYKKNLTKEILKYLPPHNVDSPKPGTSRAT